MYESREQLVNRSGHEHFPAVTVLRCARFKPNHALCNVQLVNAHGEEFRDTPSIRAATLDQRAEPKLGAILDQLPILPIFEKPLADIVLCELGEFRRTRNSHEAVASLPSLSASERIAVRRNQTRWRLGIPNWPGRKTHIAVVAFCLSPVPSSVGTFSRDENGPRVSSNLGPARPSPATPSGRFLTAALFACRIACCP